MALKMGMEERRLAFAEDELGCSISGEIRDAHFVSSSFMEAMS